MAIVLSRKGGGSGGGGTPAAGSARVLGPFPFAFDDAGLENGIAFYTPTVNDVLLDAWISVLTAFDGTTPLGDVGIFTGGNTGGLFANNNAAIDMTAADADGQSGQGLLAGNTLSDLLVSDINVTTPAVFSARYVPARFTAANPLGIVVSQDGSAGGTAVGGTAGAGAVYLMVATPSLT